MRNFSSVAGGFWTSNDIALLPAPSKLVALYLITCTHGTSAGAFRLPLAYACDDLKMEPDVVLASIDRITAVQFASYCRRTSWVVIHKALKHVKHSAEFAKHVIAVFGQIPDDSAVRLVAADALRQYGQWIPDVARNNLIVKLSAAPAKPAPKVDQQAFNGSTTPVEPPIGVGVGVGVGKVKPVSPIPSGVGEPKKAKGLSPDRKAKMEAAALAKAEEESREPPPTVATWAAYSQAYRDVYGTDPVRNTMVNGQLAHLVKRLGAEEAPLVAAWYVALQEPFYRRQMHSIALLLKDAEKLRTQWATGRTAEPINESGDERRARNMAAITGRATHGNTFEGTANRVAGAEDLRQIPGDLREQGDAHVGGGRSGDAGDDLG